MARKKRPLPQVLSASEMEALRRACTRPRDRVAVALTLDLGLRATEAVSVGLEGIDWTSQTLRGRGKGGREFELPIPDHVRVVLQEALADRPANATHEFLLWGLPDPSRPMTRFGLWKLVDRLAERALGRHVYPHLLRHSLGSALYREHKDLGVVQKVLRHVNHHTTSIYVHLSTEQQRQHLEALDPRSRLARWWSRLTPHGVPGVLRAKSRPAVFGDTVGRVKELEEIRRNFRRRVSTVLVGEPRSGRRHLLRAVVTGDKVYRLERLTPLRERLVELCEQLVRDGTLAEMPKGRSSTPFERALTAVGKTAEFTLVVESLEGLTPPEARALENTTRTWLVFGAGGPKDKAAIERVFFGQAQFVDIGPLKKAETYELARRAMSKQEVVVPDERAYLANIWAETQGNPGAILAMVEQTAKTGNLTPEHADSRRVLSATPLVAAIWTAVVLSRYPSSALSEPQWKVWATGIILGLLPLILLDRLLVRRRRARA